MIKLINNELQISARDREIGIPGNNMFDIKTIVVPRTLDGHCLDDYTFVLLLSSADNVFEDYLSKEILDDQIILTWVVLNHAVKIPGNLNVSLKFYHGEIVKQSNPNYFVVKEGIVLPPIEEDNQSIFDQAVADASNQAEKAKTEANRAVDTAELILQIYEDMKVMYDELQKGGTI